MTVPESSENTSTSVENKQTLSNIPVEKTIVFKEPILQQVVKEQVIDAPTVEKTTQQTTTLTKDDAQSSGDSKNPVKDDTEISEKSTGEISSHNPKIQFTESDHVKPEPNPTDVEESTTTTLPNNKETKVKKHIDIVKYHYTLLLLYFEII